jgi:arabinan endo-1,5-alpha-L-arabinosidase
VGRSTSITGPYRDRNGVDLAANGGTVFMEGTGKFAGPGHVAILVDNGLPWFSYHYYDAGDWNGGYNGA